MGGSVNFRILTLVRRTHALIIGNSQSNQEVHKETCTPRRSVWGFAYPCASSTHGTWVYSNIRTLQRLVIHLVARVLNRVFWFSKNTRISQNTTSITNRQELLTPKVQHYSSQYLKTIASYYFKENSNFNYLLSSQDTELSATGKLSNKIKHATYIKFNLKQKKSSRRKLKYYN